MKLVIIQACDPFHFNYLLQEYDSPIKTDMIMVRIKVKQYLPVATGRTKTVAILIIGLWVNLDSSLEFRKLILWNFSTYLSSCFWSNRMYSSSRTTWRSTFFSPFFRHVKAPSYTRRCFVNSKFCRQSCKMRQMASYYRKEIYFVTLSSFAIGWSAFSKADLSNRRWMSTNRL